MKAICRLIDQAVQPLICVWAQVQCVSLLTRLNQLLLQLRNLESLSETAFIWGGKRDELAAASIEEDLETVQGLLAHYVQDFKSWCQRASEADQAKFWLQFKGLWMEGDLNVA